MTPLYKGNEYYKKMLDLQERLRKSEEERIRLEERFSLLEHESRSRHETCINRLRMRYIDFLEEQQERDERNHQLLGALDRVDSSLAVMTAKTDRLGVLRKQHEASILASYDNRRPNGSVTGDSGVASQNDERQRKNSDFSRTDRSQPLLSTRGITGGHRVSANRNGTPSKTRTGSSYGSTWSGIRCESSQMPSFAFSRFPQGGTSLTTRGENGSSFLDNFDNTRNFLRSNNSSPLQHRDIVLKNTPDYDYRTNNSSRYAKLEYPLLTNTSSTIPPLNSRYDRSVVRDLATSGAYEPVAPAPKFFDLPHVHSRGPNPYEHTSGIRNLARNDLDDVLRRNTVFLPDQNSTYDDRKNVASISSRSPKLSEILRQEFDDEEEYVGSMVENQLERYISKIRSLHRDADPQSLEEIDHEQNTSGDLLNVTLSEDGYDLPVEEKLRDRELSRELGNALTIANDLANQTADHISRNVSMGDRECDEMIASDDVKLAVESLELRGKNNAPTSASGVPRELASINRLLGKTESHDYGNDSVNEKIAILAKNGISGDVARPRAELAMRSCKNIEEIAKPSGNSREADFSKIESRRIGASDVDSRNFNEGQNSNETNVRQNRDKLARRSSIVRELEKSRRQLFNGEERQTDENLYDIAEDLEPWNLSALERRVQEIILNDEAQDDFIRRSREVDDTSGRAEQTERAISGIYDAKWDSASRMNERKIEECIAGNDEASDPNGRGKNHTSVDHERNTICETTKDLPSKKEEELRLKNSENVSSVLESINQSSQEFKDESPEEENVGEANNVITDNLVGSRDEYETKEFEKDDTNREKDSYVAQEDYPEDTNLQYEYNADGQYPATGSTQYNGEQNEQYGYADQQYGNQYVDDPNQQGYVQDPNQQYVADPNQQEYMVDPNEQGYTQDSNEQGYVADPSNQSEYAKGPNQQDYVQDSNQQYVEDPNQQDYVQDPNQQYVEDPNQQDYVQDPNQQYVEDPNQQEYVQDPNQQYVEDPNQQDYVQDPNQQYVEGPNQQDYVQDPNQQYVEGPNQQDYVQDPNQQYVEDPKQQDYVQDPNQQYSSDPNQQYATDPNQQYFQDSNHQYPVEANQEYAVDPNQQYATDPNEYAADPNQEYSPEVDPNQQYTPDVMYSEDGNQAYPAATTDYYPESQSYRNNEDYVAHQEEPEVRFETNENPRDTNEVVEDDSRKNEEVDRSCSASETNVSPKEETTIKKTKDVIKSILDSDTESTIEKNVSNTESDFDFN